MAVNIRPHIEWILKEESGVQNLDPSMTIEELFRNKGPAYANAIIRLQIKLGPLMAGRICDDGVQLLRTFTVDRFVWALTKNCE